MDPKHKGCVAELVASAALLQDGYEVHRNLSQHGHVDLVATRDGEILKLDVKTAAKTGRAALSEEQVKAGIRAVLVRLDGTINALIR